MSNLILILVQEVSESHRKIGSSLGLSSTVCTLLVAYTHVFLYRSCIYLYLVGKHESHLDAK